MTSSKCLGPHNAANSLRPAAFAALVLGIALALASTSGRAETQGRGTPRAVTVEMISGQSGLEITVGARQGTKSAEAPPATAITQIATANDADHPISVPSSGGPTPRIKVAQNPASTSQTPSAAAGPAAQVGSGSMPQVGSQIGGAGPSPMPQQPGAPPASGPPVPRASSTGSPSPMPSTSAPPGTLGSSQPVPSPSATVQPIPSPTR
jgi:hypothetical protein